MGFITALVQKIRAVCFYLCSMNRFFALPFVFFLAACEKKIDFKLHDQPDKLVVEGVIENDQPPVIVLTKSVGYFSKISAEILTNSFVHGAEVFVSNGTLTHKLKEYTIAFGSNLSYSYYSVDSSNLNTAFVGQLNHPYSLRIVVDGKEYTSTTTIPDLTKRIDSVWWKKPRAPSSRSRLWWTR